MSIFDLNTFLRSNEIDETARIHCNCHKQIYSLAFLTLSDCTLLNSVHALSISLLLELPENAEMH